MWPQFQDLEPRIAEQIETDAKYAVYLERQALDVAAYRRDEGLELPDDLDYAALPGLSSEMRQKLQAIRPRTVGQAGRIDGGYARRADSPCGARTSAPALWGERTIARHPQLVDDRDLKVTPPRITQIK